MFVVRGSFPELSKFEFASVIRGGRPIWWGDRGYFLEHKMTLRGAGTVK